MQSTLAHSSTAILLNEGYTAYVLDRGFYRSCALEPNHNVYHVDIADSYKAVAKSCEIIDDTHITVFGEGEFILYAKEI